MWLLRSTKRGPWTLTRHLARSPRCSTGGSSPGRAVQGSRSFRVGSGEACDCGTLQNLWFCLRALKFIKEATVCCFLKPLTKEHLLFLLRGEGLEIHVSIFRTVVCSEEAVALGSLLATKPLSLHVLLLEVTSTFFVYWK